MVLMVFKYLTKKKIERGLYYASIKQVTIFLNIRYHFEFKFSCPQNRKFLKIKQMR